MALSARLLIQHLPDTRPTSFQVVRLPDGKRAPAPFTLVSPSEVLVPGRPDSNLLKELAWYLEQFLQYPFAPETDRADRVQRTLRSWGEQAFNALFDSRSAGRLFDASTHNDYGRLHLQIASDDPGVLSWPWEALYDPESGFLAHTCQIERRLDSIRDPAALPSMLPKDRVNILLVVPRPYRQDVNYRSIARPLVDLIAADRLPAQVDLLRPPTFEQLRRHLNSRPGYYHVLHFDGHGSYTQRSTQAVDSGAVPYARGKLFFENEDGAPDPVGADVLSSALREHAIPAVVLNACQSAMIDGSTDDPFSTVATALLRAGIRSVVAMAYSIYVSGAQQFLPAFYRALFATGSVSRSVRAGRLQMIARPERVCVRGLFGLQDWLLPVLYEQDPLDFSFATEPASATTASHLPTELYAGPAYQFVGRDSALLALERALRGPHGSIIIQGFAGVGKTTLAKGLLKWLDQTNGLTEPAFWFSFEEIRSAEYVLNRIGGSLIGEHFALWSVERKIEELNRALQQRSVMVVWDNFESVSGIPGTPVAPIFSIEDRQILANLVVGLRRTKSKILITSRSTEDWLGAQHRLLLQLGGLEGEERWEFCNFILHDLGVTIDRNDPGLMSLLDALQGHPLLMRAVLPALDRSSVADVLRTLQARLMGSGGTREDRALQATMDLVRQSVPANLDVLALLIGMHSGYTAIQYLEYTTAEAGAAFTREEITRVVDILVLAGVLTPIGQGNYYIHAGFSGYARFALAGRDDAAVWRAAFATTMARLAAMYERQPEHLLRRLFAMYAANFYTAMEEAATLRLVLPFAALTHSLGAYHIIARDYRTARILFEKLIQFVSGLPDEDKFTMHASYFLGFIAEQLSDFRDAQLQYSSSERLGHKLGVEDVVARSRNAQMRLRQRLGE